jgi:hypothetical protein
VVAARIAAKSPGQRQDEASRHRNESPLKIEQAEKSLQLPDGDGARELGNGLHAGRQGLDA